MKVIVRGVHLRVSDNIRAHLDEHLVRPLERILRDEAVELEVHLADVNGPKGGNDKECRATLRLPGSPGLHVTEASEDLYKSIDFARDRLERAVKRELERKREGRPSEPVAV
jgi:ribosomal subunit interface protein